MTPHEIQPVEADPDELKEKYPVGTIVVLRKENSSIFEDRDYRAVVTGHSVVEHGERYKATYPGPRVNVSGNPPDHDFAGRFGASALRPCEIKGTDGRAEPTDE